MGTKEHTLYDFSKVQSDTPPYATGNLKDAYSIYEDNKQIYLKRIDRSLNKIAEILEQLVKQKED